MLCCETRIYSTLKHASQVSSICSRGSCFAQTFAARAVIVALACGLSGICSSCHCPRVCEFSRRRVSGFTPRSVARFKAQPERLRTPAEQFSRPWRCCALCCVQSIFIFSNPPRASPFLQAPQHGPDEKLQCNVAMKHSCSSSSAPCPSILVGPMRTSCLANEDFIFFLLAKIFLHLWVQNF